MFLNHILAEAKHNYVTDYMEDFRIERLEDGDVGLAVQLCDDVFREHDTIASDHIKMEFCTQTEVSCKAVLNGRMIGCYLLNEDSVYLRDDFTMYEDVSAYYEKRSIHGLAIALHAEYRGLGYGKLLRAFPCRPEKYDYVWGFHVKSLNNIAEWTRFGRRIVGESPECFMTIMDLKNQ